MSILKEKRMDTTSRKLAYPLQWPGSWPRTPDHERSQSSYRQLNFAVTRDQLVHEVEMMDPDWFAISSNIPLKSNGMPYANTAEPSDPGVAVYWQVDAKPLVVACDRWELVVENLRAILYAISSLRQLERCGASSIIQRAYQGFAALPAATPQVAHWRIVLGLEQGPVTRAEIEERFRKLARENHPDHGGIHERMAQINAARAAALGELS